MVSYLSRDFSVDALVGSSVGVGKGCVGQGDHPNFLLEIWLLD